MNAAANIGATVRRIRAERSLAEEAALLGICHKTLSRVELNLAVPGTALLLAIARLHGVNVVDLLEEEIATHYGNASPDPLEHISRSTTPDQVKQMFRRRGQTFSQWARDNGYRANQVLRVLNGFDKGHYGKAHEIAVKLGLKSGA